MIDSTVAQALNRWSDQTEFHCVMETRVRITNSLHTFRLSINGFETPSDGVLAGWTNRFLHVSTHCSLKKPLMMVSTRDGDELSMIRFHHQSMTAQLTNRERGGGESSSPKTARRLGLTVNGLDLYLTIHGSERPCIYSRLCGGWSCTQSIPQRTDRVSTAP